VVTDLAHVLTGPHASSRIRSQDRLSKKAHFQQVLNLHYSLFKVFVASFC